MGWVNWEDWFGYTGIGLGQLGGLGWVNWEDWFGHTGIELDILGELGWIYWVWVGSTGIGLGILGLGWVNWEDWVGSTGRMGLDILG